MAAPTIFEDVTEDLAIDGAGQLFTGKKFWVAQRVPLRNQLLDNITANGGEVVKLEKKADYLIADHVRPKFCPPGSISYTFIEKSLQDGQLRDPEDHVAGPPLGEAREPGAVDRPAKGGRTAYTAEDDNILYKWVRDCEAAGLLPDGNVMYKQLEAKNPRHTWQSWRDRYRKQLQLRDPSTFNLPADDPSERTPVPEPPTRPAVAASKQPPSKVSGQGIIRATRANVPPDYTTEQLKATFSAEDWEELYAAVEHIDNTEGKERDSAWERWAEAQDNQTVEQWRQYYDKVVRPSWLRDPEWKREHVRSKVEKRRNDNAESRHDNEQEETKSTEETTPTEHKFDTVAFEQPATQPIKSTADSKLMSSSTAQYESPKYISNLYRNTLKRVRGADAEKEGLQDDTKTQPRPPKRQKSPSSVLGHLAHPKVVQDPNKDTIEIFSSESGSSEEEIEAAQVNEQIMQDIEQSQRAEEVADGVEEVDEEVDEEMESVETDDLVELGQGPPPSRGLEEMSDDELPPNTPTPRASRRPPKNNFDTQAILSSPSQGISIGRLPRPQALQNEADRSSSLAPHAESDASTTQSLQEFRRSLNDEDITNLTYPTLPTLRNRSPSPTPSNSSNTSGDPDPPLSAAEMEDFFAEELEEGFHNDFIVKALVRTRFRPDLAKDVLEAWRQGKPLPDQRGIWSLADDEAVESGDGLALAMLQKKHSLDGWGGITERMRFLEGYRSR